MTLFRFASPEWLFLTIPLLLGGVVEIFARRRARSSAIFSSALGLGELPRGAAFYVKKSLPLFFYLGLACLIVALARPQSGVRETRVLGSGISIVMCVDRSGSMAAEDFEIDGQQVARLQAVKRVFKDFVVGSDDFKGRPDDLIALLAFGGFVDSHCPLTLDHDSLLELLDKIETPVPVFDRNGRPIRTQVIDEESGTAIGDALATAVDSLKGSDAKTKIVVLLSDGMQTAGVLSPEEGIKVAQAFGVKVYTIGIGTSDPAPFPQYLPGGRVVMTPQLLDFDPEALQTIAQATGGRYFHAGDTETLKEVYEEIDRLERSKFDAGTYAEYDDRYLLFTILGASFLCIGAILRATRFRTFP